MKLFFRLIRLYFLIVSLLFGQSKIDVQKYYENVDNNKYIDYIIENCDRSDIISHFDDWQKNNHITLSKNVRIHLLIDVLSAEKSLIDSYIDDTTVVKMSNRLLNDYLTYFSENTAEIYWPFSEYLEKEVKTKPFGFPKKNIYGRAIIESTPTDAEVYIDGDFVTYTKCTLILEAKEHAVLIKKMGYSDYTDKFTVEHNKKHKIIGTLQEVNPD